MPTRSRTLLAVLSLVLAACVALTVDGTAAASPRPAGSTSVPGTAAPDGHALELGADAVLPRREGRVVIRKWNVRTLYYYETLPAKWDWSLNTAVAKWNASGGGIRLARTVSSGRAQVRIGYANIGDAAGMATVGATRNAFVHLSSRISTWDAVNARNRVVVMNVFAHELGHVLGFQHTTARCSLMAPVIDVEACNTVPASQPGYYKCRTIDTTLVQRFIQLYGGRARYPSATWCLIDPLPPVLTGVAFSGGATGPVTVHWTPPRSVPAGSTMVLKRWETTTCGSPPGWAETFRLSMASGAWQDEVATQDELACFQLQLLNRYGAARPAQKKVLSRWVPPVDAPVVGAPSYDFEAEQFRFTATVPDGTTLRVRWDAQHPTTCVTSPTGGTNGASVPLVGGHGTLTPPTVLPQCVSFFSFDLGTDRYSVPVSVTFTQAEVPAPVIGAPVFEPGNAPWFHAPISSPAGTHVVFRNPDPATGPCLTSLPSNAQPVVFDSDRLGEGVGEFYALDPDACVSFFAVDDTTGRVSDATSVTVHEPAPTEALDVSEVSLQQSFYPLYTVTATGAAPGHLVAVATRAGPCPSTVPAGLVWSAEQMWGNSPTAPNPPGWEDRYGVWSPGRGTNCAFITALDWFANVTKTAYSRYTGTRTGAVTMREYVDSGPLAPTVGEPTWDAATGKFSVFLWFDNEQDLRAIYDPAHPSVCPTPGQAGVSDIDFGPFHVSSYATSTFSPPAPETCVAFYSTSDQYGDSAPTDKTFVVPQG